MPFLPNFTRDLSASALAGASSIGRLLIDGLYPPACLVCRSATIATDGLCGRCWSLIRFIERPYCERLGTPFATDSGVEGLVSPAAIAAPPAFARVRAVARFEDGPVRRLVHGLKYGDRTEFAEALGSWMARAGSGVLATADVLVPVPLHRGRLASRRFNQAMLLAAAVSRRSGVPADPDLLLRRKAAPPQVGMTRQQRAGNVQGAFAVAEERRLFVEGRSVVLVDDVLTSGATANAAARVLLRAGAAKVDVLVFAQVVVDGR